MECRFHLIESTADSRFAFAKSLYESVFPADERREAEMWFELQREYPGFHVEVMSMLDLQNVETPVAILCYWQFEQFCYVEHLAVEETFRRRHLGSEVLGKLLKSELPVVLEVEPDSDETTHGRLLFYQTLGFEKPYKNYVQPPYSEGKSAVLLWLLSNQPAWLLGHVELVKETLYKKVYHCKLT